ncbi:helix-turn-helix domain-containing protein [Agromyces bauzanensis]|nr:helix-turn-helix transcriptional regulator [Agromyces bauzanensis]
MPSVDIRKPADLGQTLRAAREARSVTQEELASALGFSRYYLSELESGKPNMYATRLFRALRKLGVRVTVSFDLPRARESLDG